jgi:WD40 repeat protein
MQGRPGAGPRDAGSSQHLAQAISLDSGGHLIACSEDGTISVSNMNSGDIVHKLAHFSITRNDREKRRIDDFMKERESN